MSEQINYFTFGNGVLSLGGYSLQSFIPTAEPYTYTTLWETNSPFNNMYSITLNDSIDNYDEYIVYGSANRDSQVWLDTQNRYTVTPGKVNQGGCFYAGRWNTGSTYVLLNGTEMWLSGTSGYVSSSYFYGQNNGATTWSVGTYNTARNVDLHPYKIVGIKEMK